MLYIYIDIFYFILKESFVINTYLSKVRLKVIKNIFRKKFKIKKKIFLFAILCNKNISLLLNWFNIPNSFGVFLDTTVRTEEATVSNT